MCVCGCMCLSVSVCALFGLSLTIKFNFNLSLPVIQLFDYYDFYISLYKHKHSALEALSVDYKNLPPAVRINIASFISHIHSQRPHRIT